MFYTFQILGAYSPCGPVAALVWAARVNRAAWPGMENAARYVLTHSPVYQPARKP